MIPESCPTCPHGKGFKCQECWPKTPAHHGVYQARDTSGRYDLDGDYNRICVCGHTLGAHAGANPGRKRPCFVATGILADNPIDDTDQPCGCPNFRLSRKKRP